MRNFARIALAKSRAQETRGIQGYLRREIALTLRTAHFDPIIKDLPFHGQ